MDAKSYSLLHTQLCGVTSIGHIAPWLRAQTEDTQHGHAQQAGARARTRRRQTARAHRAHSTGTQACAAPSAPVRGRPSHVHACVHWLLWASATCPPAPPGRRVCGAGREPGPGEMRQGRGRQQTPTPCPWKQPPMVTHHPPMDRQRGLKLRAPVLAVSRRRAPARRGMLYSASASIHRARTHTAPLFQSTRPRHPGTRTAATTTRTFATGSERALRGPGPPCAVLAPP
jgi:hypothetical protein